MISEEDSLAMREKRVEKLQTMLIDMKKQILRRVVRMTQDSTSHRRQRRNRKILNSRVRKSSNFIKVASQSFFTLMCNSQSLAITTEIDIIEKAQKFKKNVINACQKMMHNIEEDESQKQERNSLSQSKLQENEQLQEQINQRENRMRSSSRSRSKNYKTSNEATVSMMEWLLQNFENPYPSHEQKLKMAKQGNITLNKVNNWFINARERTVKSYFSKDS